MTGLQQNKKLSVVNCSVTVISCRLPARPITRTGRLLHTAKKKKVNRLPTVYSIKTLAADAQISTFHTWQNVNLWPHFVRTIVQRHVDLLKESWVSVKTWIVKYCWRFLKKIDISGSVGTNKSLKMGKFSLAQASVKWKFVTDAPDIFGLFLSPSRSCFHTCQ